jgi:ABC-2 type transport system ATP-binding protein
MTIPGGKITAMEGPSGCGKTTILRMISGLDEPDSGTITPVTVSCVFQEDRLLPWMTVRENLRLAGTSEQVETVLQMMKLQDFGDYLPEQLSGGMRRRVAMGRALVYNGSITLMDEPFVGLDPKAAVILKSIMHEICRHGGAIFFSTHVLEVAQKLCNKVAIIKDGVLVASGNMDEIVKPGQSLESIFMEVVDDDTEH